MNSLKKWTLLFITINFIAISSADLTLNSTTAPETASVSSELQTNDSVAETSTTPSLQNITSSLTLNSTRTTRSLRRTTENPTKDLNVKKHPLLLEHNLTLNEENGDSIIKELLNKSSTLPVAVVLLHVNVVHKEPLSESSEHRAIVQRYLKEMNPPEDANESTPDEHWATNNDHEKLRWL